jgi:DNA (cytosine-5)-methyltransferase 1
VRFGSVCSGIEAASVAWHPLGWQAAWVAEIEPFPSAVLAHHYPTVPNLGDMTTLPERIRAGEVEAPDILCGGTPCQAFSVAGLRQSLDDERGNLSLTFCEIANAIDHVRVAAGKPASIVFWENVPGVLSTRDNAFGCFLAALAGTDTAIVPHGIGWTDAGVVAGPERSVAWRILDAQFFGLAQRRRRVFVVASAREGFDPAEILLEWEGVRRDSAPSRQAREIAPTIPSRSSAGGGLGTDFDCDGGAVVEPRWWDGGDLAATITTKSDDQRMPDKANAQLVVQPAVAYDTRNGLAPHGNMNGDIEQAPTLRAKEAEPPMVAYLPVTHALTGEGFDASEDGTGRGTPPVPVNFGAQMSVPQVDFDLCQTLQAKNPMAVAFTAKDYGGDAGEISPTLRAMGHGASHANGGGQVAVAVALRGRDGGATAELGDEVGHALRASSGGGDKPHVMQAMQVRRLTPEECEALQGFPRSYTAIPWRGKPAEQCPDGPRYKALGNSWAVPVIRWIGQRIDEAVR